MTTIRKAIKLLFLGAILMVLSVSYRILWEKKDGSRERSLLGLQQVRADVPGGGEGGGEGGGSGAGSGGADSGCGNSG